MMNRQHILVVHSVLWVATLQFQAIVLQGEYLVSWWSQQCFIAGLPPYESFVKAWFIAVLCMQLWYVHNIGTLV